MNNMDLILPKNHILLTSSNEVSNICDPLKRYLNISHFDFVRAYKDNTRTHLCMNPYWSEFFYNRFYYYQTLDGLTNPLDCTSGYFLWDMVEQNNLRSDISNYFNVHNGVVVVNNETNYQDLWFFGVENKDKSITSVLINNLDLLNRFIIYFKKCAERLIIKADKSRLSIPSISPENSVKINCHINPTLKNKFLRSIAFNKNITTRELECMVHAYQGLSAKEISNVLAISNKTVEHHLASAKQKLNCRNKIEMLMKAVELNLIV